MVTDKAVEATCTQTGLTEGSHCSRCDDATTAQEVVEALGHSFTNYTSNNDATCTLDGTKTAKCDRCDETKTVADEGSALGHSFTNYVSNNDATCTADGTETAKCDRCNETHTQTDIGSLNKDAHTGVADVVKNKADATCTETGYTGDIHWSCCDKLETEGTVIGAHGHNYVGEVTKEASCTEKGVMTYTCTYDAKHTYDEEIGLKAHTIVKVDAKVPTCEEYGWNAYEYCSECTYTTFEKLDAIKHSWDEGKVTTEPTCTEKGVMTYTCKNDASHTYEEEIKATGHDFIEVQSEENLTRPYKENGVWADGYYTYTCKNDPAHTTRETVKRADYSAYDELTETAEYILSVDIPAEDKAKLEEAMSKLAENLIESEQAEVDSAVSSLNEVINEVYPDVGLTLEITGNSTFYAGTVLDLKAIKIPINVEATNVEWVSSDDSVVFFSNGRLLAIGTGTVTLTATTGILKASKTVTIIEGADTRSIRFTAIEKMHYVVEDYFGVYNGATLRWTDASTIRFKVIAYQTFPYETYMVYMNGQELQADEDGYYTVPAMAGAVRITVSGAVYDDDGTGNTSKFNFWEWLLALLRKIINFFKDLFNVA